MIIWQQEFTRLLKTSLIVLFTAACSTQQDEPTILVRGSPLCGANGIMFGSDGLLYAASVGGRMIAVVDPETGHVNNRLGSDKGVEGPDDLTFGPDGSLYWTSILTGEVGRRSPDGVTTTQMVAVGVNPITFSDDGRLFVALDFMGDALYELDPLLIDPPRLIAENLGWLNGMDWGPDGFLYGPIWKKGQVVRVDVDSGTITVVSDGFNAPAAVKFDSQDRLHVGDHITGQVIQIDIENGRKKVIATGMPGLDNLAFNSQDRLFVSHAEDGAIFEILDDGTIRTVIPGGMTSAGGIAVFGTPGNESVFIADAFTLREFDGETGKEMSLERRFSPFTVVSDSNVLVMTSWYDNSVQVWDPKSRQVIEEYLDFQVPINAVRFQGDLIVAELGIEANAARVVRVDTDQQFTLADADDGLILPSGMASFGNDLWVADWASGSILQVVDKGVSLSKPKIITTGLSNPEGLAVDRNGNLLVVETGADRVSLVDPKKGNTYTIFEGIKLGVPAAPNTPPTWIFSGISIGSSGAIYIACDIENVLYRFEQHLIESSRR